MGGRASQLPNRRTLARRLCRDPQLGPLGAAWAVLFETVRPGWYLFDQCGPSSGEILDLRARCDLIAEVIVRFRAIGPALGGVGRDRGRSMSSVDPPAGAGASTSVEVRAAARDGVREVVAAGGASGRSGRRWVVPAAAVAAVAAAACAPVAWPLLAGGAAAAALAAAFGQVGGVGGGLLAEAVIRAWDRSRARGGPGIGQSDLRRRWPPS